MNRILHFDAIRGTMILWVLVTHISLNYGIITFGKPIEDYFSPFLWISFFMVPFYVFSGYFYTEKKPMRDFMTNKARKLLIPFCTFTVFGFLVYAVYQHIFGGHLSLGILYSGLATGGLISNTPCWFFLSLFLCNVVYYIVRRAFGGGNFIILLFFIIAYLTCNKTQILGYGNVLLGTVYIHIGCLLHKHQDRLNHPLCFALATFAYISIGVLDPQRLSFVLNMQVQGNYILNFIFSTSACFILWFVFSRVPLNNAVGKYVTYLGTNSLVLFATHRVILNWIYEPIIRHLMPNCSYGLFLILALLVILLTYHLIDFTLRRFFPMLLGL